MQTTSDSSLVSAVRKTLQSNWFYIGLLIMLIAFPHIVGWVTGDSPFGVRGRPRGQSIFLQGIFIELFIFSILTMSYNLMFGFTGVVSFGHALFFGLGGYTLGIVLEKTGVTAVGGLGVGIALGIALAGIIGCLIALASLRLKGVYFAIFTLAVAEIGFIWVGRWAYTNAEDGFPITNIPEILNPNRNRLFFYYLALIAVVFTFLFIRRLMNSPTGRVLLAIRENEDRARTIGFNTLLYKVMSITIASMMAAGAGMIYVLYNVKVGPESMSVNFTIEPLIMMIIGGIGTFAGPIIGTTGLHLSERLLNREFDLAGFTLNIGEHWSLILGIAFVIVVLVFPYGIVGTWNRWRASRTGGRPHAVGLREAVASILPLR